MFWIILVRIGRTWHFECGDYDKHIAQLFADGTVALIGNRKQVHMCCVDDDSLESISRVIDAKNSLERF